MSQEDQTVSKGPSKKELNKLARKEKRSGGQGDSPSSDPSKDFIVVVPKEAQWLPILTRYIELTLKLTNIGYAINTDKSSTQGALPGLFNISGGVSNSPLFGDASIAVYLVMKHFPSHSLIGGEDSWVFAQVHQWLLLCAQEVLSPSLLENALLSRTYLAGHNLTLADVAVYQSLTSAKLIGSETINGFENLSRWARLISSNVSEVLGKALPLPLAFYPALASILSAKAGKVSDEKVISQSSSTNAPAVNVSGANEGESGTCPPLEGAIEGQVCTRFPPEPSGYLHIGHAKAVLLNQYYAQRYKGRLVVRFDDTNPSKEKEEFEENILADLLTLGVKPDMVSHSSDYFTKCEELARKLLSEGKAYMDDTDQETMQAERLEKKESRHRNVAPQENLAIFEALLKGEPKSKGYCLRAKIDMSSLNGTMRDPVLYRYNDTPHHRTGTRFKAYPTYDFACPIIDSIEGVTHALRTTEYNDRDEQYHWIQEALGIRRVHIQAFGKMNFVHTVLSKRKLTWFVEQGLVEGWFDPRFPTIQGCVRRGMDITALKSFILSQGASRRIVTMEWDKFWSANKAVLEENCARYMGVTETLSVPLSITNVDSEETLHSVPIHPQKPEMGTRVIRRSNRILVDQVDAVTYKVGEEITFLRWGNIKILNIERDELGNVTSLQGSFDPNATNFSKTKKATWLADSRDAVRCEVWEFQHIISKAKLEDDENFQDFVNPNSKHTSHIICDPCLKLVHVGEVIQLERKGFYRCDRAYGGENIPPILIAIPDGKAKK